MTAISSKKKRRKLSQRADSLLKRRGLSTSVDEAPDWARMAVFEEANIVTWSGQMVPLANADLFPIRNTFLDAVLPARRNSIRWLRYIHPLDTNRVLRSFSGASTFPFSTEYRLIDKSGEALWVRHTVVSSEKSGLKTVGRGFVKLIQVEKELELESLRISEREQNRIGQDLHDDLCQVLAGVSCLMRVAEGRLASKVPEEVPYLTELNQQIIDAMHRTRALTHGLFPGKIQIADIRGALLELASQVKARFRVDVKTEFVGRFPHHSREQIIQIYRLTQEAISNSIKHGHATCINVRLEARHANMSLSIVDNGTGLNQAEPAEKGVGQHIMQSRTRSLGGELEIRNATDRGVAVLLNYPFKH
jgi:signal transduction histidine kinase